jgi:hypothetical protein
MHFIIQISPPSGQKVVQNGEPVDTPFFYTGSVPSEQDTLQAARLLEQAAPSEAERMLAGTVIFAACMTDKESEANQFRLTDLAAAFRTLAHLKNLRISAQLKPILKGNPAP